MNNLIKNSGLFAVTFILSALFIIAGYLWLAPQNTQVLAPFMPKTYFSLVNAPTESLKGQVATLSGKVGFISRAETLASLISYPVQLQQGEELDTYGNGYAKVVFPKIGTLNISPDTQVNFIQTLPANFVVYQKDGSVTYEKNGDIPESIVALDLLINVNSGKVSVSLDKKTKRVTVDVVSGSATAAYSNINNNTNILKLKNGDVYVFDNNTLTGAIE